MEGIFDNFRFFNGKYPHYKQDGVEDSSQGIPFLELSLAFAVFMFLLERYLDSRQLANFKTIRERPSELVDIVNEETFRKTLVYGYDKLNFGFFESTFMFVESWSLIFLGYLPFLWDWSLRLTTMAGVTGDAYSPVFKEMITTSFFLALTSLHDVVVSLPFSLYSTFVIEERHGFNKSTLGLFIKDKLISLALMMGIGCPIISGIVWLVRWGGPNFYTYVWAFLFVISLVMMSIYPTLIAPLFNKYTPLEDGEIKTNIEVLAKKVSFPLTKVYIVDGSRRSAHSNAYFYGFLKNKRIVLYDTLIKQVSMDELLAILGHEMGHWKLWHTVQGFVISQAYTFLLFLAFSYSQHASNLFESFGFARGQGGEAPVFVGLLLFIQTFWSPVEKFLSIIVTFNSRVNEFAADRFSVDLGMGQHLASGLIKISVDNLGNMVPDKLYSMYHFSHPPLIERLRAIETHGKKSE